MTTTTLPTHAVAIESLNRCVNNFADSQPIAETDLVNMYLGINESVQVRDYALGYMPEVLGAGEAIRFILTLHSVKEKTPATLSILSAFAWEAEEVEIAVNSVALAGSMDSDYSLAKLLSRVISAGWPSSAFATMRKELHPKVVEHLATIENVIVGDDE